ncbi:hypothetical protein TSAR_002481, partial [Trichomalopsis sarcophagae]
LLPVSLSAHNKSSGSKSSSEPTDVPYLYTSTIHISSCASPSDAAAVVGRARERAAAPCHFPRANYPSGSIRRQVFLFLIIGTCHGEVPNFNFLDGNEIPAIGFDTYLMTDQQELDTAVTTALETGYKYIDTAYFYKNEKTIGKFLKNGLRKEVHLPLGAMRASDVGKVPDLSLSNLGLEYLDMYLIHRPIGMYPTPDFDILVYDNGSIAFDYTTVSHFSDNQFILEKPVKLGKIELNPYLQQDEMVDFCHNLGIVVTAHMSSRIWRYNSRDWYQKKARHDRIASIAKKHNKSPAQVTLRFGLQRNLVAIPKSSHPKRIRENFDVFDFTLTDSEMKQLKALDQHGRYRKFVMSTGFPGAKNHPEYPFSYRLPK